MDSRVGMLFTHPKYGVYEVISYEDWREVTVKFHNTGGLLTSRWYEVSRGIRMKDPQFPSVCGVGVTGGVDTRTDGVVDKSYIVWCSMIQRCYYKKALARNPTYKGCSVCPEWLHYRNFKMWFMDNYFKGGQLDKDIKVEGNRVYSPDACMFVSHRENTLHSLKKRMYRVLLLSPDGVYHKVHNHAKFCREKSLDHKSLISIIRGNSTQHKGWKFIRRLD